MFLIHFEYEISRREKHALSVGQGNGLKNIYRLCDICHLHSVGIFIEYIKSRPANYGVPHGVCWYKILDLCLPQRYTKFPTRQLSYRHAYRDRTDP